MLEQLAIAQRHARSGGGDEMGADLLGIGERLHFRPSIARAGS